MLSPFAATRGPDATGVDLVEQNHQRGDRPRAGAVLRPGPPPTPLTGTLSKVALPVEDRHTSNGKSVAGFYYVFDGPSITQLLTSYDSGGDTGSAIHTPQPKDTNLPVTFTSKYRGEVKLTGALDAGNAEGGSRVIPSDNLMKLFHDAFGYTVLMPSTLPGGTFNSSVSPDGRLVIRGGPDGGGATGHTGGSGAPSGGGPPDTASAPRTTTTARPAPTASRSAGTGLTWW